MSAPRSLAEQRAHSVLRSCGINEQKARALVASLAPSGEYEQTVALQIIAAQQMSLHLLNDAALNDFLPAKKQYAKMACDLMTKQAMLVESLHRHRAAMQSEQAVDCG